MTCKNLGAERTANTSPLATRHGPEGFTRRQRLTYKVKTHPLFTVHEYIGERALSGDFETKVHAHPRL